MKRYINKNDVLKTFNYQYNPINKNNIQKLSHCTKIQIDDNLKNPENKQFDCEVSIYLANTRKMYKSSTLKNHSLTYKLDLNIKSYYGKAYVFKKSFKFREIKNNELLTGKWDNYEIKNWNTTIDKTDDPNVYILKSFTDDNKHVHKSKLKLNKSKKEFILNMIEKNYMIGKNCECEEVKNEKGHWYEQDGYQYISSPSLRIKQKIKKYIFMDKYFDRIKCKKGEKTYTFDSKFHENDEIDEEQIGIMVVSNNENPVNKNKERSYCEIISSNLSVINNEIKNPEKLKERRNRFSGMNDEPDGEDLLDYLSFAKILSLIVIKGTIKPPVTFGLYSSWGNGKSFIKSNKKYIQDKVKPKKRCCKLYRKVKENNYLFF